MKLKDTPVGSKITYSGATAEVLSRGDLREWLDKRLKDDLLKEKWGLSELPVEIGDYCLFQTNGEVLFGWRKSHNFYQSGRVTIHSTSLKAKIKINRDL